MRIGWKIYFCILTLLLLTTYFSLFKSKGLYSIYTLDFLISIMSLVGLFCFAFKKKWLQVSFWKVYFFVYIVWDFSFNLLIAPRIEANYSIVDSLIGLVIIIPLYIGLYLYAFKFLESPLDSNS